MYTYTYKNIHMIKEKHENTHSRSDTNVKQSITQRNKNYGHTCRTESELKDLVGKSRAS